MKALLFFIIITLNINIALGQNDTLVKKRAFYIGVNTSKINLLNEYRLGDGTEYSGLWQNINGSVSSEFEGFLRIDFTNKFYLKPTISYSRFKYTNSIYDISSNSATKSPYILTNINFEMNETVNKLKLYLPFGNFITFKKHMLYFEAGLGLNQVLSIIDDFKLNVRINKTNIPIAEIEKRISKYNRFSNDLNSRVFVRMSSRINLK